VLDRILNLIRQKPASNTIAKNRLKLMLIQDREQIVPQRITISDHSNLIIEPVKEKSETGLANILSLKGVRNMKKVFASFLLAMLFSLVFVHPISARSKLFLLVGKKNKSSSFVSTKIKSPLEDYTKAKIAIAPFDFEKKAADMGRLTIDVGTMLSLRLKENEWIFDKSKALQPVADQLAKHKLSPKEIYEAPALAAKIGEALGVDVIIVGRISNMRIKHKMDDTKYYDMSQQAGISGTTKYTLLKQWATIDVHLKIVEVKNEKVVWTKDKLKGYIKYIQSFQAQTPRSLIKVKEDNIVKADMVRHLTMRVAHALYPDKFEDKEVPEIVEKPKQNLVYTGGKPIF